MSADKVKAVRRAEPECVRAPRRRRREALACRRDSTRRPRCDTKSEKERAIDRRPERGIDSRAAVGASGWSDVAGRGGEERGARLTEQLVGQLGYIGIALILVLGGLGLPIPEEAPVLLAAVLTRNGRMSGPLAFSTCLAGVLLGDFIVYFLGYYFGERVLSLPHTRRLLTRAREAQIKGYFHRHGFKILIMGRFAVGFRTAAYLTAGILKLPPLKLLLTDFLAALLSTSLMFLLGYLFANQIEQGIHDFQQWVAIGIAAGVGGWLLYRHYKGHQRAGLPVGPPVLVGDDLPLPPDDLAIQDKSSPAAPAPPVATAEPTESASPSPQRVGPPPTGAADRLTSPESGGGFATPDPVVGPR